MFEIEFSEILLQKYTGLSLKYLFFLSDNFPVKYKSMKDKNDWITQGIKITCKHKRSLYAFIKSNNYPKAKEDYIKYFKILRQVTQGANKRHYSGITVKFSY